MNTNIPWRQHSGHNQKTKVQTERQDTRNKRRHERQRKRKSLLQLNVTNRIQDHSIILLTLSINVHEQWGNINVKYNT